MPVIAIVSPDAPFRAALREVFEDMPEVSFTEAEDFARLPEAHIIVADGRQGKAASSLPTVWLGGASGLPLPLRLEALRQNIAHLVRKCGHEEGRACASGRFYLGARLFCTPGGTELPLTEKEAMLLACLLDAPGGTATREALLARVWGYAEDIDTHTLETHIYRLRAKLKEAPGAQEAIVTTESGYALRAEESA